VGLVTYWLKFFKILSPANIPDNTDKKRDKLMPTHPMSNIISE